MKLESKELSISFIITSMNEVDNIRNTINEIKTACTKFPSEFGPSELIFVNDGSTDKTGEIIEKIVSERKNARCIHHEVNLGLGAAYKSGVLAAKNDLILWIPGENSVPAHSIINIVNSYNEADIIITYPITLSTRKKSRQILSIGFTWLMNKVSPKRIKYFNGPNLYRKSHLLQSLPKTNGHAYQLEILFNLLKIGYSFIELGIDVRDRPTGKSKALRPKNLIGVMWTIGRVFASSFFDFLKNKTTPPFNSNNQK